MAAQVNVASPAEERSLIPPSAPGAVRAGFRLLESVHSPAPATGLHPCQRLLKGSLWASTDIQRWRVVVSKKCIPVLPW